jgi:hypothetical protein
MKWLYSLALLILLVSPAWAERIDLRQSDNTITPLGGAGDAAKVAIGGSVQTLTLATGVTTNATSSTVAGVSGNKTFWAEVICSAGACTQTVAVYGARTSSAANGLLLCTITLSDTPRDQDACAVSTAAYPFYYVVTTNTTGTAATGAVYAFY